MGSVTPLRDGGELARPRRRDRAPGRCRRRDQDRGAGVDGPLRVVDLHAAVDLDLDGEAAPVDLRRARPRCRGYTSGFSVWPDHPGRMLISITSSTWSRYGKTASTGVSMVDRDARPQPGGPRLRDGGLRVARRPRGGTRPTSRPASASSSKKDSGASTIRWPCRVQVGARPQRGDHHRPQRDRRYEMSIHDVDMDDFGMLLDQLDLVGEVREIGRQDRCGELSHGAYRTRRPVRPQRSA